MNQDLQHGFHPLLHAYFCGDHGGDCFCDLHDLWEVYYNLEVVEVLPAAHSPFDAPCVEKFELG